MVLSRDTSCNKLHELHITIQYTQVHTADCFNDGLFGGSFSFYSCSQFNWRSRLRPSNRSASGRRPGIVSCVSWQLLSVYIAVFTAFFQRLLFVIVLDNITTCLLKQLAQPCLSTVIDAHHSFLCSFGLLLARRSFP